MSGFESKRKEMQDFLHMEEERLTAWELQFIENEEQRQKRREVVLAFLALIGLAGASGATGFYFGVMYAVQLGAK